MRVTITALLMSGMIFMAAAFQAGAQGRKAGNVKTEEKMGTTTVHLTKAEFLQKVYDYEKNPGQWKYEGTKPAIVDFYATWCGPCRSLGPVLEELAAEYGDRLVIYKVDVDKEMELSQKFEIRSIPTLLYIPVEGMPTISPGAPSKAQLKQIIEEHLLK